MILFTFFKDQAMNQANLQLQNRRALLILIGILVVLCAMTVITVILRN